MANVIIGATRATIRINGGEPIEVRDICITEVRPSSDPPEPPVCPFEMSGELELVTEDAAGMVALARQLVRRHRARFRHYVRRQLLRMRMQRRRGHQ